MGIALLVGVAFAQSSDVLRAQDLIETLTPAGQTLAPTDEVPTAYRIGVILDTDFWTYSALERVRYTNNENVALDQVVFHIFPNADFMCAGARANIIVRSVKVDGRDVAAAEEGTIMNVPLAAPLRPGKSVDIEIRFKGQLPPTKDGADMQELAYEQLFAMFSGEGATSSLGNFGIYGHTDRIGSMALWHPIVAAYDERGWDRGSPEQMGDFSYFDVADYQVTVRAPADVKIIGGGLVTDESTDEDQQEITFSAGRAREMTMQISRDYVAASAQLGDVLVNSWSLAEHADTGREVLAIATKAVAVYEEEFGPYPYRELDVVEAPLLNGVAGVEFPGLCTIAQMFYGADRGTADASNPMAMMMGSGFMKETLEFVVAHEVAHQWWNATIGSDSREHPFIDEALANFSAVLYFEKTYGAKKAAKIAEMQVKLNYHMSRMMGNPDQPVDQPTANFPDPIQYVATVYGKGGMFYLALRKAVGAEAFKEGVQRYYRDRYLRLATPDDLPAALGAVAPEQREVIDALCDRWLRGAHGDEDLGEFGMSDILSLAMEMMPTEGLEGEEGALLDFMKSGLKLLEESDMDLQALFGELLEEGGK